LPANLAVAVHPQFQYALVEAGSRTVVVARDLVDGLRDLLSLGEELAFVEGRELEGCEARHPWIDRSSKIILGEHVTLEAGTGSVHTAPGHGHDDYVVGQKYGLETYAPVDERGCFTDEVPEFAGQFVFKADPAVIDLLEARGALLARQEIEHSYPHCWRCKKAIIFRATDQWFLSMDHQRLRERALEMIDAVRWIPRWGRERIHGMIANRPDWCLSRQRSWGVPLVAVQCRGCGRAVTSEKLALHVAELFAREGSDAWFERELADVLPSGFTCPECGGRDLERVSDILDVWFDSGVSFSAVVEADHGRAARADLYLEGSDQHRGWFHSALLTSVATRDRAPYAAVLTHGFVLDGNGRKMSKSLGNVIAPQQIIEQYGADILRLWVSAEDYRDDVRISDEILKRLADSYRRIRNTTRNLLGNLYDFDPDTDRVVRTELEPLDQWALTRLDSLVRRCRKAYEDYEFHVVYHALNNFCSVDMSALYFDIVKDRLYCSGAKSRERRSAQTVMYDVLQSLAGVIAPILSFTAEEVWAAIPTGDRAASVFLADFPEPAAEWRDDELTARWDRLWEIRAVVTRALEEARKSGRIGHSLDARVVVSAAGPTRELLEATGHDQLAAIWIVSQVELRDGDNANELAVSVEAPRGAKCGRCWNYDEEVGLHRDHPEVCGRCHAVVAVR